LVCLVSTASKEIVAGPVFLDLLDPLVPQVHLEGTGPRDWWDLLGKVALLEYLECLA